MNIIARFASCIVVLGALLSAPLAHSAVSAQAQATAPAAATRQLGTVKAIAAGTVTLGADGGGTVTVALPDAIKVVQLAPGSTDLKTAQPATVGDIAEGDRILIAGKPGDNGAFTATRVVLMKSSAIAQSNASRQQDWQRRGSGGIVASVDPAAKTIAVTSGTRKVAVTTTSATTFRRYAPGSVKFEEAKASSLGDIQPGDQVRVRGEKAGDGTSVAAEEVVSGAFRNLAGTIVSVDAAGNALTLKDLTSKKNVTVAVTSESDLRQLPPEMAARFAARAHGGAAATGTNAATGSNAATGAGASGPATAGNAGGRPAYAGAGNRPASADGAPAVASGEGRRPGGYGGGSGAPSDLSQVIGRLPKSTLGELKPGEALMIVASGSANGTGPVTAITLLSGVEPLLSAPQGASSFSISPWSLGGGGGEGGEGGGGTQ